jgi:hypothetical protein
MFKMEFHSALAPQEWDRVVGGLGASHFHAAGWAAYRSVAEPAIPVFILARDQHGQAVGAALAYLEQSERLGLAFFTRRLVLQSHPLLAEGSGLDPAWFLSELDHFARDRGCVGIIIGSFFSGDSRFELARYGFRETSRLEFHLDLQDSLEAVWKKLHKEQQEKIRRAARKGVEVRLVETYEAYLHLRDLQLATRQRRGETGEESDLESDESHYRLMAEALGATGLARLFLAFHDGEPISAILFGSFNARAYSIYSASNAPGYSLGAPSLIYWRAVEQFHSEGYLILNRGGVPIESQREDHPAHGVYFYKTRLGTEPRVCRGGSRILHPLRYRLFRTCRRILGR